MAEIVDTSAQKAGFHTYHFGSTVFKASNGEALTLMYGDFKDGDEARRFLEWNTRKCFEVLSQETRKTRVETQPNTVQNLSLSGIIHQSK